MGTAYDTAWVARLGDLDRSLSLWSLNWVCQHQLADGSWGAPEPVYYHDRVISTLAAMTALCRQGRPCRCRLVRLRFRFAQRSPQGRHRMTLHA